METSFQLIQAVILGSFRAEKVLVDSYPFLCQLSAASCELSAREGQPNSFLFIHRTERLGTQLNSSSYLLYSAQNDPNL